MHLIGIPVAALVASTGELEALTEVLAPLPSDLPAAIIVLRHLQPDQPSHLAEILASRCSLQVVVAEDGAELLPSCVYICPPGVHILVRNDARLALIKSGSFPPNRPSADLLLVSMALTAGPRALAVVLSGKGNDGATGATAIHLFGGMVVASDRVSSKEFAMPAATIGRNHAIDYVVPPDQISSLLGQLLGRSAAK